MIPQKTENYEMHRRGEACYLIFPQLDRYPELRHLFTTRCGGFSEGPCATWNLGFRTRFFVWEHLPCISKSWI